MGNFKVHLKVKKINLIIKVSYIHSNNYISK